MKRGLLVYERDDAAQNSRFIELSRKWAGKLGLSLELCYADALGSAVAGMDFALLRTRAPNLHSLVEAAGARCFNSARLNAVANDKMLCYDVLRDHVPMAASFDASLYDSPPFLPCVVKSAHGHGGKNVYLIYDKPSYLAALANIATDRAILQPFVDPGRDKRIYVIGGKIRCAMLRTSRSDFRSNYKLGGSAEAVSVSEEEAAIVETVQSMLPMDYAGVDIIYDHGHPLLGELEDPVGARMVYEHSDIDIICDLMEYIASVL